MTKILSVEKEIENLRPAMREGCNCKGCEDDRANIGEHCVIRQALIAQREVGAKELRDSGLLEEKEDKFNHVGSDPDKIHKTGITYGHNTLARAIKAHLDELIKSTK